MASIRECPVASCRQNTSPHVHHQVRWRENGRQTGATFDDGAIAHHFRGIVEADGSARAYARLDQRDAGDPDSPAEVWTLDRVVEHHIEHLTGVTAGTRAKDRTDYVRTWGAVTLDGARLGDLPVELVLRHPDIPLTANPCEGMRLPSGEDSEDEPDEMVCLSPDEFAILYSAVVDYWKPLVLCLYTTGMRWGEATALQVKHVNLASREIRVRRAWKWGHSRVVIGAPKNNSRRTIKTPEHFADMLAPLVQRRNPDDLVFISQKSTGGNIHHGRWLEQVWYPARWRASRCAQHMSIPNPCGCAFDTPRRCKVKAHKELATPAGCGCSGTLTRMPRVHDLRH